VGRALRWIVPVAVVAGIAALIYFTPVFAVRAGDIEVRGLGGWVDRNAVSEVLSKDVGVPLARLSTKRLEAALEAMPAVESAEVKRDWPTGLTVTLVPRVPAAAVLDGDLYVLLDASAEEVAWVEDPPDGLPVIDVPLTEGNRRIVAAVLTVAGSLPAELAQQVVSIGAKTEDTVAFKLTRGTEVIWGDSSEPALKAAAVNVLLNQPGVTQIDVSAPDSPVVR
jgi:cell division protein FtsQ